MVLRMLRHVEKKVPVKKKCQVEIRGGARLQEMRPKRKGNLKVPSGGSTTRHGG